MQDPRCSFGIKACREWGGEGGGLLPHQCMFRGPPALLLPMVPSLTSLWSLSLLKLMLMLCYYSCCFYCYCYFLLSAGEKVVFLFGLDSMILDWNPASSGVTVPQFSTQIMPYANPTTILNKKTV